MMCKSKQAKFKFRLGLEQGTNLRAGDKLRDRLRWRGDFERRDLLIERLLERLLDLDRESDLRFLRALSRSSFSFSSFSKAARGSSITL